MNQSLLNSTGRRTRILIVTALAAVTFSALTAHPATPQPPATRISPVARVKQWLQTGEASWYGLKFQGHKTATGEKFDMNSMTCAHRTLPLGSWVKVTNIRNHKSIFVRVNDRGPFTEDRIVDLSYAAARAVGIDGLSRVKLEQVQPGNQEMARALATQNAILTISQLAAPPLSAANVSR